MERGPVVLLGQGEQYDDPDDWRELMRARRIRRGVELAVRRDGLTTLVRPEDVPELAAVLDRVDPPDATPPAAPALSTTAVHDRATSVPASPAVRTPSRPPPGPPPAAAPAKLPTAAPRRRFFGVWLWVLLVGALLLVRLCAPDGFSWPAFGARADEGAEYAPGAEGRGDACERAHGWIARAACEDPAFARLRPLLAQAYTARVAGASASERADLASEQQRWTAGRAVCRTDAAPGGCLARLYRARITELQASAGKPAAVAQAAPPAPVPARATQGPVTVVSGPEWVRRPAPDDVMDAYPERALRMETDGRALLSCRATASGALTACDIVSEDPPDFGFGGAALRLSRLYQMRPTTSDGRSVEGAKVDVPVVFRAGP